MDRFTQNGRFQCQLVYEVSLEDETLGQVIRMRLPKVEDLIEVSGRDTRPCWEFFWRRDEPCQGCPVSTPVRDATSLLIAPKNGREGYEIRSMEIIETRMRVVQHCVDDQFLDALISERIERVMTQAQLSPQERAVFDGLCLGLQAKEIAVTMGLSPRTVKFHAANILHKVGAESRVSLLRSLLMPTNSPEEDR